MKTPMTYALGILLAIALLSVSGAFYVLDEGQQAVILQFGRPVGDPVIVAGLHFKVPFIQEVRRFDKRLLIWDGDPNQIPTAGREFIWVDSTARWRIVDPLKFLESVATESGAQSRLDDIIDSVIRDLVSANPLVELVRSSTWETPKTEVLEEASKEVVEELKKEINLGREGITHPSDSGRGAQDDPPVRYRSRRRAHQAAQLRRERAREGLRAHDLRAQADRGPFPVGRRRAERGDFGQYGKGAARNPLHGLPGGAGDPR